MQRDDKTLLECHGKLNGFETLVFGGFLHADSPRDRTGRTSGNGNSDIVPNPNSNNDDNRESSDRPQFPSRPSSSEQRLTIGHGGAISAQQQQELFRRISRAAQELRNRREELKVRALISPIKDPMRWLTSKNSTSTISPSYKPGAPPSGSCHLRPRFGGCEHLSPCSRTQTIST